MSGKRGRDLAASGATERGRTPLVRKFPRFHRRRYVGARCDVVVLRDSRTITRNRSEDAGNMNNQLTIIR
jgi:hypothetical protein